MPMTSEAPRLQCANCGAKIPRLEVLRRDGRCFCSEPCARSHRSR